MNEILNKVGKVFANLLDDEEFEISEELSSDDLEEWDSMFHIQLIMNIENEFGIKISTDEIAAANSVKKIIDIIGGK